MATRHPHSHGEGGPEPRTGHGRSPGSPLGPVHPRIPPGHQELKHLPAAQRRSLGPGPEPGSCLGAAFPISNPSSQNLADAVRCASRARLSGGTFGEVLPAPRSRPIKIPCGQNDQRFHTSALKPPALGLPTPNAGTPPRSCPRPSSQCRLQSLKPEDVCREDHTVPETTGKAKHERPPPR